MSDHANTPHQRIGKDTHSSNFLHQPAIDQMQEADESAKGGESTVKPLQGDLKQEAQMRQQANGQPLVSPFPMEVFPAPLQEVISQQSLHSQFRPDWLGASMLYAASVAVGNSIGIRYNTWAQKALLYIALVGMPGTNKSGPAEYAVGPLRQMNRVSNRVYKEELVDYERWSAMSKKERQADGLPLTMTAPVFKTLLVSDVTLEALLQTHQHNPYGLGMFADELAAWFQNFNRYSKGSNQETWNSNWSFTPVIVIRKTAAPIQIDSPFISVLGTIQPGVLSELAKEGRNQNGFIDRILFAYPDDQQKPYDSEGEPDQVILEKYTQCIENLCSLRSDIPLDANGNPETKWLAFSPEASERMRAWKNQNTDLSNRTDNPSLKGIYAKLEAYCIRFALLLELLDWSCHVSDLSIVQATTVSRAIQLTEYFRQNGEKVHFALNEQTAADRLPKAQHRLFSALPDEVSTREAVTIAGGLQPPISERTAKSMLKDGKLFKQVSYGKYRKQC